MSCIFTFPYMLFLIVILCVFFQWGAAFCVRGGPKKEKMVMQVSTYIQDSVSMTSLLPLLCLH